MSEKKKRWIIKNDLIKSNAILAMSPRNFQFAPWISVVDYKFMHDTMSPPVSVFGVFTKGERDFMFMGIDKQRVQNWV